MGDALDHLAARLGSDLGMVELARIFVPAHRRVLRSGQVIDVDAYWREIASYSDLDPDEIEAVRADRKMRNWLRGVAFPSQERGDYYAVEEERGLLDVPEGPTGGRPVGGDGWPTEERSVLARALARRAARVTGATKRRTKYRKAVTLPA